MADGRYDRAYREQKRYWARIIEREGATCVQGLPGTGTSGTCVMPTREIPVGTPSDGWHLAHADNGVDVVGPAHIRCNCRDGGQRRHARPVTRWAL